MAVTNDEIKKLTDELIEECAVNGQLKNISNICEENYDDWNDRLFPVLRLQGKSCFGELTKLFHKLGCTNANEKLLSGYFSKIRKKRGLTKNFDRAPSLTSTRSVDVVPTAVVVSPVAVPVAAAQPPAYQVQATRPVPPKQADEVAHPHVYAKVSLTPPIEFDDLREEEDRWRKEAIGGWVAPWTGVDEFVWLGFLEKIEEYNLYNSPKWTANGNNANFRKELGNEQQKNVYDLLKKKVVVQRKI